MTVTIYYKEDPKTNRNTSRKFEHVVNIQYIYTDFFGEVVKHVHIKWLEPSKVINGDLCDDVIKNYVCCIDEIDILDISV